MEFNLNLKIRWILLFVLLAVPELEAKNALLLYQVQRTPTMGNSFFNFLEAIRIEKHFEILVIFQYEKEHIDFTEIMKNLIAKMPMQPIVLINEHTKYEFRTKFNSEILLLRYLKRTPQQDVDFKELQPFPVRTNIRLLLISQNDNIGTTEQLMQYCKTMQKYQIIDILAIANDFEHSQHYLRCSNITSGIGVEQRNFATQTAIFENRLKNLNGLKIRIMVDLLHPRTMWDLTNPKRPKLVGHVGQLLNAFARKHNANLYSITGTNSNKTIYYQTVANITHNTNQVDIGGVIIPNALVKNNLDGFSYPYEMTSYCFMIPIPDIEDVNQFYIIIVKPTIWLMLFVLMIIFSLLLMYALRAPINLRVILLNDKIIRGLLSQSFPMPWHFTARLKFIIVLICYTSIMVNTMYVAYLQSFFTHPPTKQKIHTVDDIVAAGLKVLLPKEEIHLFTRIAGGNDTRKLPDYIEIENNFHKFTTFRNTFNVSYMYPVTYTRWLAYQEQQQNFAKKVFYYTKEFTSIHYMFQSLPVPKNSRYMEALNRVILQVHQGGLRHYWVAWNFHEMVRLKFASLKDLSVETPYADGIELSDLYWIWVLYLGGISLSLLCFILERLVWYQQKKKAEEEMRLRQSFNWLD